MFKKVLFLLLVFFAVIPSNAQMILEFNTDLSEGTTITLPLYGSVNVIVDWGDGMYDTVNMKGDKSHTYTGSGKYIVKIAGNLEQFGKGIGYDDNCLNIEKLVRCTSFGEIGLKSLAGAFYAAINLVEVPSHIPATIEDLSSIFRNATNFNQDIGDWNVSNVTNMRIMFMDAISFNQDIGDWDVSNVTDMSLMFDGATSFNQNIGTWNVKNVTNMSWMFNGASSFNQDIGDWDVSNVKDMSLMFMRTDLFNQDIGNWDVSKVTNMSNMFFESKLFNQDIGSWDVSNVKSMSAMFSSATSFNKDIGSWDVCSANNMSRMFSLAKVFNQDIGSWDVSNVTDMSGMFRGTPFNQNISNWNVSNVVDMNGMFYGSKFNQDIGAWDVGNVKDMSSMFYSASSFNQNIDSWDVGSVTDMSKMFKMATAFDQDINNWNVSNVVDMRWMFNDASSFNKDIGSWNVSNVEDMLGMFLEAHSFNGNIGAWDVSSVSSMQQMFYNAVSFNQNIGSWDVSSVTDMFRMFMNAISFDQDISNWNVGSITNMQEMFRDAKLSTVFYNNILIKWSSLALQSNVYFSSGSSKYTNEVAGTARQFIIDNFGWTITDGGESNLPAIQTDTIREINFTSAVSGGIISNDAGSDVSQKGIVWNTTKNPTLTNNLGSTSDGSGTETYSSNVSSLTAGETYYVRAYATNGNGTEYGNELQFIPQQEINITGNFTANNKEYNGRAAADVSTMNLTINNMVSGYEDVSISEIDLVFDDKNVGQNKLVTIDEVQLIGADSSKYKVNYNAAPTATANITCKNITISEVAIENKIYDGTTGADILIDGLKGIVNGDSVFVKDTLATFDNKNVGISKTITANITLSGTDTINYNLIQPSGLTADITKKDLTVSNATADNKVYDGTTTTTISGATIEGVVTGDDLTIADSSAIFNSKNVETSKTATSNITLTGTDTINYSLIQPTGLTADITKKELSIINATADNKVYDGKTTTIISGATLEGIVSGDDLIIADSSATFDSKNAGTFKTVISDITLSGADTINYSLTQPTGLTADITKKELTVTNATVDNKVYDGTTSTTISGATLEGVFTGDDLTVADSSATFDSKNVGTSKTVASNITLTGADTINYSLTQPTGLTANITKKELTITDAVANDKTYDGLTSIEVSNASLNGVISGDEIVIKDTLGIVDDKSVGESKEVSSAITLSGVDTINYYLTQPTGLTVDITPKTITLSGSFTAEDKDYDETTDATIKDSNLVLDGVISPDIVTLSTLVLNFSQAEIGNDITVIITEAKISGNDAGNYELSLEGAPTTTANILEPVGIDKNNSFELSVYPNPFDNQLNIDAQNGISRITITTITGTVITHKDGTCLNNINVSQLPQGVYLVNVVLENNQSKTYKMIKK